jgi:AcrR family transcriptional regulator
VPRSPRSAAGTRRPAHGAGRQALLDATIRVARREGIDAVTFRSVAEEAGVTNGLIVHHFGTRDALMREALRHAARASIDTSLLEPTEGDPIRIASGLSERVAGAPADEIFQFQLVLEAVRRNDLLDEARATYDAYIDATEHALEHAGISRSRAFTRLVFAALDGLSLQQLVYGDATATTEALDELYGLLRSIADEGARARQDAP